MSGHTPGPWGWYWRQSDDETDCGVYWEKHQGQAYSVCRAPRYQTEDQWTADARLIAAAPELLEALSAMTYLAAGPDGGVSQKAKRDILVKARAAIAKATGESA